MIQSKFYSYFNYLFIALVLLWAPLQGTVLTIDGKGRILLFCTIMSFIVNVNRGVFRNLLFSKPIIIWLIWCIYVALNTYFQGYEHPRTTFPYFVVIQIFCPCMIMAVSAYEYLKDAGKFLKVALCVFIIYSLVGTFVMDIAYVAEKSTTSNINSLGNALALNVMMIIFFAGVRYCRKEVTLKMTTVLILFTIIVVVISATRKALGASVIMIIALILSQFKLTLKSVVKVILPVVVLYYGFTFVMDNTHIGERFIEMEEVTEKFDKQYNIGNNIFLKAMGDRAPQYILGAQLFTKHPITGVGLTNFPKEAQYPFYLHTEYMVQICECGIIGCILFLLFYTFIICRLLKIYKYKHSNKQLIIMMLGTICAFLFIYLTAWSYSMSFYFVVLGSIIGFIYSSSFIKKN